MSLFFTLDFLFFWGAVFLITTTLVALLKKENKELTPTKEETKGITDTYKLLFSIIKMPAVLTFCLLILTAKVRKYIYELLDANTTRGSSVPVMYLSFAHGCCQFRILTWSLETQLLAQQKTFVWTCKCLPKYWREVWLQSFIFKCASLQLGSLHSLQLKGQKMFILT